jgi:hypothetical protein
VQLLLYDSDPRNPDLYEISKVTDYIVSYACKGNSKMETEVDTMRTCGKVRNDFMKNKNVYFINTLKNCCVVLSVLTVMKTI